MGKRAVAWLRARREAEAERRRREEADRVRREGGPLYAGDAGRMKGDG